MGATYNVTYRHEGSGSVRGLQFTAQVDAVNDTDARHQADNALYDSFPTREAREWGHLQTVAVGGVKLVAPGPPEDRTVGVSVALGSTYFNGGCSACLVPETGGVVTVVHALASGKMLVLCPGHHGNLLESLRRVKPVGG
jgi:hypothetical protein